MRRLVAGLFVAGLLAGVAAAPAARADCKIKVLADFPLEPSRARFLVSGAINQKPVKFILDTGADASTMPYSDAVKTGVTFSGMNDISMEGIGGAAKTGYAHFDMGIGTIKLPREIMLVTTMSSLDHDAVALIGRELLMQNDLELDMAGRDVKVLQPQGCAPAQLVYWNKPYAQTRLQGDGTDRPAILIDVLLNGHVTPALVDSGASHSYVTPAAARAAGVPLQADLEAANVGGIGAHRLASQVVTFDTFTIGEETIRNAKLAVADLWRYNKREETGTRLGSRDHELAQPHMLLGADFLRAHHVLVANSAGLMLFSYNGGPVFDIPAPAVAPPSAAVPTTPPTAAPAH